MIARYASAVATGMFVTFGLLFVMQLLISLQPGAQVEPRTRHYLTPFTPQVDDTPVQPREKVIPRHKLTKTLVPPPRRNFKGGTETIRVAPVPPAPPSGHVVTGPGAFSDGPLVALVRVAPVYPARALTYGIEGYVIVQFDVTADGQVANVVIVESTDSVFDSAAIRAAERFRFKPRVVDGLALASYGIQNLFRFSLEDK